MILARNVFKIIFNVVVCIILYTILKYFSFFYHDELNIIFD